MGFFDFFAKNVKKTEKVRGHTHMPWLDDHPVSQAFDGSVSRNGIGEIKDYQHDYYSIALRCWQALDTMEFPNIVVNAMCEWIVGSGLNLQWKPVGVEEGVVSEVEKDFRLYAKSNLCSWDKQGDLHDKVKEAVKGMIVSGDALIIYRTQGGYPTIDIVDGWNIQTPPNLSDKVKDGVLTDKNGRHLAYYVKQTDQKYTKIKARDELGNIRAELAYLKKRRADDVRGQSAFSFALERMYGIGRYSAAVISGAESRAKVPYFFTNESESMGFNPNEIIQERNGSQDSSEKRKYLKGLSSKIATEENKNIYNLPTGTKISAFDSKMENSYGEFTRSFFNYFCAGVGIPPEIAMNLYGSNYSASRMASKQWEILVSNKRKQLSIYKNFFNLYLTAESLKGNVKNNVLQMSLLERLKFENSSFVGVNVPHVDPLKEVKATVEALENNLIDYETAIERLGTGDFAEIQKSLEKQKQKIQKKEP